jgi:hypothetical protein
MISKDTENSFSLKFEVDNEGKVPHWIYDEDNYYKKKYKGYVLFSTC